jgi:NADH:ubiquinone oxidoreductase subunit 2 (subunit N)
MYVGTLGAINQNKIKRLFAYSSIAHVGYLLIALGTGSIEAVESLLVYIVIYILMIINVFGILLILSQGGLSPRSVATRPRGGQGHHCP